MSARSTDVKAESFDVKVSREVLSLGLLQAPSGCADSKKIAHSFHIIERSPNVCDVSTKVPESQLRAYSCPVLFVFVRLVHYCLLLCN